MMNVETALQSCFPCAYLSSKAPLHLCKSKLIQFNNYLILEFLMGFWGFGVSACKLRNFPDKNRAAVSGKAANPWFLRPDL